MKKEPKDNDLTQEEIDVMISEEEEGVDYWDAPWILWKVNQKE